MKTVLAGLALIGAIATPITASAYVVGVTSPGKWGSPVYGTGATVTWSLMATGTSCADEGLGCAITALSDFMPVGYLTPILGAFDAWSAVADLTFVQVADDGAAFDAPTSSGDIRLGGHVFDGVFGVLALMGGYAYRLRDKLELDRLERHLTRIAIGHNLILVGVALASLSVLFLTGQPGTAGIIYFVLGPLHGALGFYGGVRADRIQKQLLAGTGAAD